MTAACKTSDAITTPETLLEEAVELDRDGVAPEMVTRLLAFWDWLKADQCTIRDQEEQLIPLRPNRAQRQLFSAWLLQALQGRPIRCIVLKARKLGVSTFVQALYYFLARFYSQQIAAMLAHEATATGEIFQIAHRMAARDGMAQPAITNRQMLIFGDTQSHYSCHTAGGEGVGAGGTPNLLHLSEVALWKKNKSETHYTATNAVPNTPTSCIVQESTARGRELFFEAWDAASQQDHPYEPVFIPWFLDDRLVVPVPADFARTDEERVLAASAASYGVSLCDGALQWRREKITDLGVALFKQEYPATPEEAIEGDKGRVLPGMRACIVDDVPFDYALTSWHTDRIGGADFGYMDPTVIISAVYWDQTIYVIQVFRFVETLAEGQVAGLMDGHHYWCDPAATQARLELAQAAEKAGVRVRFAIAPRARDHLTSSAEQAEFLAVRKMAENNRLKILRAASEQLILEADNLFIGEKTGTPDKARGEAVGHFDTLDALRYLVMGVNRTHGPTQRKSKSKQREPLRRDRLRAF